MPPTFDQVRRSGVCLSPGRAVRPKCGLLPLFTEQPVRHRVVRALARAAFGEGREHVGRDDGDRKHDRGFAERVLVREADEALLVILRAVGGDDRSAQDDRGEHDERPGIVVVAEERAAVAGIGRHDMQADLPECPDRAEKRR